MPLGHRGFGADAELDIACLDGFEFEGVFIDFGRVDHHLGDVRLSHGGVLLAVGRDEDFEAAGIEYPVGRGHLVAYRCLADGLRSLQVDGCLDYGNLEAQPVAVGISGRAICAVGEHGRADEGEALHGLLVEGDGLLVPSGKAGALSGRASDVTIGSVKTGLFSVGSVPSRV